MLKLALIVVSLQAVALADDFTSWKVPDAMTTSPKKCAKGDATECLHMAWSAEAGSKGFDESNHDRLANAQGWHARACELTKRTPCPNAERVKKKIAQVDALKTDSDKARFYCTDALDGVKLRPVASQTSPVIVIRDCIELLPEKFRDGLAGLGKMSQPQKQLVVLQSALDNLCPDLATKPAECSTKSGKALSTAKQREASAKIIGVAIGGDVAARGDELVGWLIAK